MKNKLYIITILMITALFSSCLKSGLEELPAYDEADIKTFKFEYRWFDSDKGQLRIQALNTKATVNKDDATISCEIVVPATKDAFTAAIRSEVTLQKLVGFCNISTAATISPAGNAPKLGAVADWSAKDYDYVVKAANGDEKQWKIIITNFTK